MKYIILRLKRFCGFITGIVFFLSGIVKLLDPVGAGLVVSEYFNFLHIPFLDPIAKQTASFLAFMETAAGAALITGVWRRLTAYTAVIMQVFFTIISIILVIFNPEMDCGCFGEVIHLTHMETLLKNIVLCLLLAGYSFPTKALGGPKKKKYVSFGLVMISVLAFSIYSWLSIPLMDFTDYKPASVLKESDEFPTSESDLYDVTLVYEKEGIRKEFCLEDIPDSTWTYVSTETRLKKEYGGSVIDLSFYDDHDNYRDHLAAEGKVMVISVYDPYIIAKRWSNIAEFIAKSEKAGFRTLLLTAATENDIRTIYSGLDGATQKALSRCTYFADYKTLITLNRSNAGLTYFCEGYLIRKWPARSRPDAEELDEIFHGDDTEIILDDSTRDSLTFQGFLLYIFAVMLLF